MRLDSSTGPGKSHRDHISLDILYPLSVRYMPRQMQFSILSRRTELVLSRSRSIVSSQVTLIGRPFGEWLSTDLSSHCL